ncbi:DUF3265 domain-containing protein [Vibrio metschnikovii]|nr:DUF3265 domain-containing protein [Vibrio metschnikovii]EKO3940933.1 DUF3265 domain-containing protein [Vibrio metschnikovii]
MTKRSRGIRNAWHFRYALILLVFSAMRKVGSCVAHPLTRRYMPIGDYKENHAIGTRWLLSSFTGCGR